MTLKHIYLAGGCFWGTEHLFIAEDLPREGAPEMPKHEVQVQVLVADGQAPVFTKVVR